MRSQDCQPIFFSPMLQMWVVTRYQDAVAILKNPLHFSSSLAYDSRVGYLHLTDQARATIESVLPLSTPNLANADPPDHTRLRNAFERAFLPSAIARFEPVIRDLADRLIDDFVDCGEADIIEQFVAELPIHAISCLIGIPETEIAQVKYWHRDWTKLVLKMAPAEQQPALAQSLAEFHAYLLQLVEARKAAPQRDLTSALIQEMDFGRADMTVLELVNILTQLIAAGTETTTSALGTCLYRLLQNPAYWQTIASSTKLTASAIEEALRCNESLQGLLRVTTEDTEVGGIKISRGTRLYIMNTAANRDATIFSNADGFDPHREKLSQHIAFGVGIHRCLGASLARLEMRVSIERLGARLPSLEIVPHGVEVISSPVVKSLKRLRVRWTSVAELANGK
jgi:cytochrome P450